METSIRFRLNGQPTTLATEDGRMVLWVLRTDLALTGTKSTAAVQATGHGRLSLIGRPVVETDDWQRVSVDSNAEE